MSVPASSDELTPAWLGHVLADVMPGAAATGSCERISADYGYAGEIYRCSITAPGGPNTVIVKLWSTAGPAADGEVRFYRDLASDVAVRVPRCFHADVDSGTERGVLVLEDIAPAQQGDALHRLPTAPAVAIVEALARMQAPWLTSRPVTEVGWLTAVEAHLPDAAWIASRRTEFLDRFGPSDDPALAMLLERFEVVLDDRRHVLMAAPRTLVHGDFHLDNLLFLEDGTPVVLDWARVFAGPAALNLVDVLFGMVQPDDVPGLIATYRTEMERLGVVADWHRLEGELGAALVARLAVWILGTVRWQPKDARQAALIADSHHLAARALATWKRVAPGSAI